MGFVLDFPNARPFEPASKARLLSVESVDIQALTPPQSLMSLLAETFGNEHAFEDQRWLDVRITLNSSGMTSFEPLDSATLVWPDWVSFEQQLLFDRYAAADAVLAHELGHYLAYRRRTALTYFAAELGIIEAPEAVSDDSPLRPTAFRRAGAHTPLNDWLRLLHANALPRGALEGRASTDAHPQHGPREALAA